MKKAISAYLVVAAIWAVAATAVTSNQSGLSFSYRLGRSLPAALLWPWEVVKSPYTFVTWAFGDKRPAVFEGMYQQCMSTRSNSSVCVCRVKIAQAEYSVPEFEALDAAIRRGGAPDARFAAMALKIAQECR